MRFEITQQHLKLIRRMNVKYYGYVEFGAPGVDPKRPYGNSSVYHDIAEILGIEPDSGEYGEATFSKSQKDNMLRLHKETATALQIVVVTGEFTAGLYESEEYRDNWKKA